MYVYWLMCAQSIIGIIVFDFVGSFSSASAVNIVYINRTLSTNRNTFICNAHRIYSSERWWIEIYESEYASILKLTDFQSIHQRRRGKNNNSKQTNLVKSSQVRRLIG